MAIDFSKGFTPVDFDVRKSAPVELYLRFHDDIADRWDSNANNTLRFLELKSILTSGPKICYFQKAKADRNRSHHSIFIQLNSENAVVFRASLGQLRVDDFTTLYSYFILSRRPSSL